MLGHLMELITGSGSLPPTSCRRSVETAGDARKVVVEAEFSATVQAQALARLDRRIAGGQLPADAIGLVMAWANEAEDSA